IAHRGFVKAVAFGDYNNDGRLDLYVSCLGQPNALYRNDGPQAAPAKQSNSHQVPAWRFTDVAAQAGVQQPLFSFPTWFWDYDNDGWQDILVFGYRWRNVGDVAADYLGLPHPAERPRLYHNNRDGTFRDVTKQAGLDTVLMTMGSNYGDLDNDGWLDFYAGTGTPNMRALVPNRMFRNHAGTGFGDVTSAGGFGHLQKGHGIAFTDLDNDGDQDIYEVLGGAYTGDTFQNVLFENPGNDNHWITLKLVGTRSSRDALGARMRLRLETDAGERIVYATVTTGGSFGSGSLQQEIGLGQATAITAIEIYWPSSGISQTLSNLPMDRAYQIKEGLDRPYPLDLARYDLSNDTQASAAHPHNHHTTSGSASLTDPG
ncbi:MAG: CRTAC1 family protein, partial [Phycisphaerae bacterium]